MNNKAAVKMRSKLYQLSGAALFLLLAPPVKAALPVFDNWVVATVSGVSTPTQTSCQSGYSCSVLTTGDGFTQIQWVDTTVGPTSGDTFIQTIITNQSAAVGGTSTTLPYHDESFIMLGGTDGILSKQGSNENDALTSSVFSNQSTMYRGWAQGARPDPTDPADMFITQALVVNQGVYATTVTGDEFSNNFNMGLVHDVAGAAVGTKVTITQDSGLGDGVVDSQDKQEFKLVHLQGDYVTASASGISLDATPTASGGDVTWAAGDDIMIRWIGQRVDLGPQGTSVFGFEGMTNNTAGVDKTTFSTTSAGIIVDTSVPIDPQGYDTPFDWDTVFFGAVPSL